MSGQPCPIPVIKAKEALNNKDSAGVTVVVDNIVAVQNLEKMALGLGYGFNQKKTGESRWEAAISKKGNGNTIFETPQQEPHNQSEALTRNTGFEKSGLAVLIKSDTMGAGSDELGRILMKGYIFSLTQLENRPDAVVFLNSGVKLTTGTANTIEDLKSLESSGTKVMSCGTCLNYYEISDQLQVGEIVDMMKISTEIAKAGHLISL